MAVYVVGEPGPTTPISDNSIVKISWVTYAPFEVIDGVPVSAEADGRYRVFAPVRELAASGHDVEVIQFAPENSAAGMLALIAGEVVVLGKLVPRNQQVFDERAAAALDLVRRLQARGVKVIADINDNHFENPARADYFRALANAVDAIVASTPQMAQVVRRYSAKPVTLARDPYEGERGEPAFAPSRPRWWQKIIAGPVDGARLKLLWFGYPANLDTLALLMEQLLPLAQHQPMSIHVVSRQGSVGEELCREMQAASGARIRWTFAAWSPAEMRKAFADTDLVVLPSKPADARKAVKSPNRLVNALWAGRLVIAHPLPAYQEFAEFASIVDDMAAGVRWALDHPDEVTARIRRGQAYIDSNYSARAAAREWEHAITTVCSVGDAATYPQDHGLKLGEA